jgi:lysozyme
MQEQDDKEQPKNYKRKILPGENDNALLPSNLPQKNIPEDNRPGSLSEVLRPSNHPGKRKTEQSDELISSEHKNIIREQTEEINEVPGSQHKQGNPAEKEKQEVYETKKFNRPFDMDENGLIHQTPVSGTVTSRYTVLNNSLSYIRVDQLTEYDEPGSTKKRRKLESLTVKFSALNKETQLVIRKKMQKINRTLSTDGSKFIAASEGNFHNKIYDAITGKDATYDKQGKLTGNGDWTIGYGHKITAPELKQGLYFKGIESSDGLELFKNDLGEFVKAVNDLLTVFVTQNELDALVSYAYQQGKYNTNLKAVTNLINQYKFEEAAKYIQNTGNKVNRRKAESEIFKNSIYIPDGYYDSKTGAVKMSYYKIKDPKGYEKYKNPVIF